MVKIGKLTVDAYCINKKKKKKIEKYEKKKMKERKGTERKWDKPIAWDHLTSTPYFLI